MESPGIWIEQYRPPNLSEVAGQREIVERLQSYVKSRARPHLLFTGSAGVVKTTCVVALSRAMFVDTCLVTLLALIASVHR